MSAQPVKSIALCADDYGLHPLVDEAVRTLAQAGRLSATSCMSTAPGWKLAAKGLQDLRGRLSLGLHFNLTEGHGVQPDQSIGSVIARAYTGRLGRITMVHALEHQLDAFEDALGMRPDFIDGHQHVHQLPQARAALVEVMQKRWGDGPGPWLRSTAPAGRLWREPKAAVIALLGGWSSTRLMHRKGFAHNRGFAGVYGFDAATPQDYGRHMQRWLAEVGHGALMMCHPAAAPVDGDAIGRQRAVEYAYLGSEDFSQALTQSNCQITQGPLTWLFAGS